MNFMEQVQADDHRKTLARNRKREERKRKADAAGGPKVFIQIEVTSEEAELLRRLASEARDPFDFRRRALLTGAKFVANTGRGKGKIKGG